MEHEPQIIGISGWARSGKDTIADYLQDRWGWKHIRVADPFKESAVLLNPIIGVDDNGAVRLERYVKDGLNDQQWNSAKESPYGDEVRRFLQMLGNEASRGIIGENVWADLCAKRATELMSDGNSVVVSSVRFPSEADAIRKIGGIIIRLERAGYGPANHHASEMSMNDYPFDMNIVNDGGLPELFNLVDTLIAKTPR